MKVSSALMLITVTAMVPSFALDLELLRFAGPETKQLVGANVDRAVNSPLGVFLQSRIGPDNPDFRDFITASGFDPRRDVREIVLISEGKPDRKEGLVAARGTFNGANIVSAVVASGGRTQTYGGIDLVKGGGGRGPWVAFPAPSMLIAGEEALVKAAIDRKDQPSGIDARLMTQAQTVGAKHDIWFAGTVPSDFNVGKQAISGEAVESANGGATLGSMIQFSAEALMKTEKDAQAVVELFTFLTSMLRLQRDRNPDLAKVLALLDNAELKRNGSSLSLTGSVNEADLEKLIPASRRRVATAARQ